MFRFTQLAHTELIHSESVHVVRKAKTLGDDCVVVDGKRVHREERQRFTIAANVQPATGQDLQMLPEGDYVTDGITVWQGKGNHPVIALGDFIERGGKLYEIRSASDWGPYVQATAAFVSQGADR